ncbi:MAG: hypothetical protein ACFFED_12910 [Candidatus Thorarchaeota archaeon]
MSEKTRDVMDFVIGILVVTMLFMGVIVGLGGWSDQNVYLKLIGIILTLGFTSVTMASMRSTTK